MQTSQTEMEMGELIHYEENLAACYEAEYLLTLKFQEEIKNRTYHAVYISYPDTYEVTTKVKTIAVCNEPQRIIENECKLQHPESIGVHEAIRAPNLIHPQKDVPAEKGTLPCYDSSHSDGPQRKRMCLQRPEV